MTVEVEGNRLHRVALMWSVVSALIILSFQPACLAQEKGSENAASGSKEEVQSRFPPKGWEVLKKEIPSKLPKCEHYELTLHCADSKDNILLARLYWYIDRDKYTQDHGFNRASCTFRWLKLDRLLLVRWTTCPQGQGTNTAQTHLIVARVEDHWVQVYRHTQDEYARDGPMIRCQYTYNPSTDMLTICEEDSTEAGKIGYLEWHGDPVPEGPLNGGEVIYLTEWHLKWDGRRLGFLDGRKSLDLDKREFHVWEPEKETRDSRDYMLTEVAEFLAPKQKEQKVAELRKLNPQLRGEDTCSGVILIDAKLPWRGTDERIYYDMWTPGEPTSGF
jgi:hypothetical protein